MTSPMDESKFNESNNTRDLILYSPLAIGGATFLGGPLAAGYLISENFRALKKTRAAGISLVAGIITTIVIFGALFMLPENMVDSIPNQVIPVIYMGIIWSILSRTQGAILKLHKENGNKFYSGWRVAAIGLIALLINGMVIGAYLLILMLIT